MNNYLGIDPGIKNLGYAVINSDDKVIESGTLNLTDNIDNRDLDIVVSLVDKHNIKAVHIERFVPYDGLLSKDIEKVNRLIGGLEYLISDKGIPVITTRAVSWKVDLSHYLFRKGFNNPSNKRDKVFSNAAAKFICGEDLDTDHESDAICLAYMIKELKEKSKK